MIVPLGGLGLASESICLVLDDRPRFLDAIVKRIAELGVRPEIADRSRVLQRKITQLAKPDSGLTAILLDNHIDDYADLGDWQRKDVSTDSGTTAGYRIASEILIPRINRGELPRLPIGIMSAHDVDRVRDEYEASGHGRYEALFFFTKDEVETLSGESARFFDAMADAALSLADKDSAYIAVAEDFRRKFHLAERDMSAIFSLTEVPTYAERVERCALSVDSLAWHDMAAALLTIQSLLLRLYGNTPEAVELAASRLKNARLAIAGQTALQALKTGKVELAHAVIAELSLADMPQTRAG